MDLCKCFNLRYTIIVKMEDTINNKLLTFKSLIVKPGIEVTEEPTLIEQKKVTEYVQKEIYEYCRFSIIDTSKLVVHSYEIQHEYDNLDIYFLSTKVDVFDESPEVYVVYKPLYNKPILNVEQINDNTVMWTWIWDDNLEYSSDFINFEDDNIIAQLPIGISYYIESGLYPGQTITRYVNTMTHNGYKSSDPVTFVLSDMSDTSSLSLVSRPKRNEKLEHHSKGKPSRLKAFHSGIGDFKDCQIFKPDTTEYSRDFKIINEIYGVRASRSVKYSTIKFFYRFRAQGKVDYTGYQGGFNISVTANTISDLVDEPVVTQTGIITNETVTKRFDFSDNCYVAEIKMSDLFAHLWSQHQLDDPKYYRASFDVSLTNITGRMKLYVRNLGSSEIIDVDGATMDFSIKTFFSAVIRVVCYPSTKTKDYIEIHPPIGREPLVGAVNGDFEISEQGLKDYIAWMPEFNLPDNVYDVKYYCDIENELTVPSGAFVQYKFDNQVVDEDYTLTNGDRIVFSSTHIIPDQTEYKEFITQFEKGIYTLDDSREHEYRYSIDISTIDQSQYKRLEYNVVSDNNDIFITSVSISEQKCQSSTTLNFVVKLRALQNAIAKWNPYIHNGYYYYNNEERYLYSKCIMDLNNIEMKQFAREDTINIEMYLFIKEEIGEYEKYTTQFVTKEELLIDSQNFIYHNGYVMPKEIRIIDGFEEYLETYEYITKPIVCDKTPTSIKSITWDEVSNQYTGPVKAWAITYDDVIGEWRDPVEIFNGQPVSKYLIPSKIMLLKFELKCSHRPNIADYHYDIECESHFEEIVDDSLSINHNYKHDILQPSSHKRKCQYISKIYNLGKSDLLNEIPDLRAFFVSCIGRSTNTKIYYQMYNQYEAMHERLYQQDWKPISDIQGETVLQYIRFKIEIGVEPNEEDFMHVSYIDIDLKKFEYKGMEKEEYLSGIGNIVVEQEYDPKENRIVVKHDIKEKITFNAQPNIVIDNVLLLVSNLSKDQNFNTGDVVDILFKKVGEYQHEYDLTYNTVLDGFIVQDSPLIATSKDIVLDTKMLDKNYNGVEMEPQLNKVIISPIPQQYSPIIIYEITNDIYYTPLKRVFFVDDYNEYTLTNKETFISDGFKTYYLQEHDIDTSTVVVRLDGILNFDFIIEGNNIIFDEYVHQGVEVEVNYKINNSFVVNFTKTNEAIITLHGVTDEYYMKKIKVFYETNIASNLRKLDHICLNPIYNPLYKGFIYISNLIQDPYFVTIVPMEEYIHANGINQTTVLVIVEDKYNNPIEGIYVNAACGFGKLDSDIKVTDINGIASYIYTSSTSNVIDEIKVAVTDTLQAQATITNRRLYT